jgi:hypothetical protein
MDFLRIFIAAFSATNLMTTFSYIISHHYGLLFKEPVLLNYVLENRGVHLHGKLKKASGWIAHYIIGFLFVMTYEFIWTFSDVEFGWRSGLVFGIVSGFVGIFGWQLIFLLPRKQPDVRLKEYYIQLMFAHIIFALAVVVAFTLYEFDPVTRVSNAVGFTFE